MKENANDFIQELLDESRRRYQTLTPGQRREVDIQRASRIIYNFCCTDDLPPRIAESYRAWLIENREREYVRVAMERVFDDYFSDTQMPDYRYEQKKD